MLEILTVIGALSAFLVAQWQTNQHLDERLDTLSLNVSRLQGDLNSHVLVSELANRHTRDLLDKIERKLSER